MYLKSFERIVPEQNSRRSENRSDFLLKSLRKRVVCGGQAEQSVSGGSHVESLRILATLEMLMFKRETEAKR